MVINGANVNLNDDDSLMFIMDAGWIERTLHAVTQHTGQKMPRYIKPVRMLYLATNKFQKAFGFG